jgi:hypothetical protein
MLYGRCLHTGRWTRVITPALTGEWVDACMHLASYLYNACLSVRQAKNYPSVDNYTREETGYHPAPPWTRHTWRVVAHVCSRRTTRCAHCCLLSHHRHSPWGEVPEIAHRQHNGPLAHARKGRCLFRAGLAAARTHELTRSLSLHTYCMSNVHPEAR